MPPSYDRFAPHFDAWQDALGGSYDALVYPRLCAALARFAPHARRVADLGLGTGDLAIALAREGYEVVGVDVSRPMLEEARGKIAAAGLAQPPALLEQDIRALHLDPPVDAALCVYTVVNQLTGEGDLDRLLVAVRRSLVPGGIFVFELNLPAAYDRFWTGTDETRTAAARIRRVHRRLGDSSLIEAGVTIEHRDGTVAHDRILQRPYADAEIEAAVFRAGFRIERRESYDPFGRAGEATKALWTVGR